MKDKNIIVALILVLVLAVILGLTIYRDVLNEATISNEYQSSEENENENSTDIDIPVDTPYDPAPPQKGEVKKIGADAFNDLIKAKKTFVVTFSQDGCHGCELFLPIYYDTIKEAKIGAYEVNITDLYEEDFEKADTVLKSYSIQYTPTFIMIKDGEELEDYRLVGGNTTKEMVMSNLKKGGFIK